MPSPDSFGWLAVGLPGAHLLHPILCT